MEKYNIEVSRGFSYFIEITIVFGIFCILVMVSSDHLSKAKSKAYAVKAVAEFRSSFLHTELFVFNAIHGRWPEEKNELGVSLFTKNERMSEQEENFSYSDGAVHLDFDDDKIKRRLTVRPTIIKEAPLGPVCWMVKKPIQDRNFYICGIDLTTIPEALIPIELR